MLMSVPELQDYQQQTTSFDVFGWFRAGRYLLTAPGEPQFVPGAAVTPALARQLGPPLLGQWFADDTSAVISTSLWRRLGGGREIIGSAITLDERQYTDHRRHAANVPASARESGDITRRHRGVDSARSVAVRREPGQRQQHRVRPPQTRGIAGTGEGGRQASRHCHRRHRSRTLSELHGGRGRPARVDDRDGRRHRPSPAADPARRRRPPAAHCLRQRRHAAAGAIRRPRPRDGDPRRARRVATAARAALLRRGRARVGRRRRRRRRSERDPRSADPGRGVRIHPACR